jgi:hypothetical protein
MLSDEMTTGSVTSSDAHKRVFAQRSHAWNILQPRFKEAFLEVSPLLQFLHFFILVWETLGAILVASGPLT